MDIISEILVENATESQKLLIINCQLEGCLYPYKAWPRESKEIGNFECNQSIIKFVQLYGRLLLSTNGVIGPSSLAFDYDKLGFLS